jgi:hypothetical protein
MPVLQCPNGHVSVDREAVVCAECGEPLLLRRGWRQDDVLQTSYAPFSPQATLGLGLMMMVAGVIALAMGVPLTLAVGVVLLLVGGGLALGASLTLARRRVGRRL